MSLHPDKNSDDIFANMPFTEENYKLLLSEFEKKNELIEMLNLGSRVLTTLCNITAYKVFLIEAIRNEKNEIENFEYKKVKIDDDDFDIAPISIIESFNSEKDVNTLFEKHQNKKQIDVEYSKVDKKGKIKWFSRKHSIFNEDSQRNIKQVLIIIQEVTDKKLVIDALQDNKHFIKSIADSTPDILYVIDLQLEKIVYINNAIYDLLHYSPEQVKNMGNAVFELFFHPDDRETIKHYFKTFNDEPQNHLSDIEFRIKDALGERHILRCRHSIFKTDEEGLAVQLLGIGQDVTEFKETQKIKLKFKLEQQQLISQAILKTQEEERSRISEALHNGLGQILYGVKLNFGLLTLNNKLNKNSLDGKKIINDLLEEAIAETKTISFELMPLTLKDFGLEIAIKDLLNKKFQKINLNSTVRMIGLKKRLDSNLETIIFRIVQELINNSIKHAKAKNINLFISKGVDYLHINLTDDGIGFDSEILKDKHEGFGLRNINNRVNVLGGQFVINNAHKNGTDINIDIPL